MAGAPPRSLWRRLAGHQNNNLWFWVFVGPFVVGLGVFVIVPIVWSVVLSLYEARNTVSPTRVRRPAQLPRHARRPGVPVEPADVRRLRRLHRAADVRLLAGPGAARQPGRRGQGVLPIGVLPAGGVQLRRRLADLEDVDLQRRALRPRQHRAAGARLRGAAVALAAEPAAVLGGDRQRAAVAAGRLLHVVVPRRPAAHPDGALRGRRRRRGVAGLADVPLHHLAAAAGDVGGGLRAAC